MGSESFEFRICTPAGVIAEEPASSVTLPGPGGEIGILPQHRRYVALLESGLLSYVRADTEETRRMYVSGGVCAFEEDTLTVLADQVELPEAIDRGSYAAERPALQKLIAEGNSEDPERIEARRRLQRIESLDKLLGAG